MWIRVGDGPENIYQYEGEWREGKPNGSGYSFFFSSLELSNISSHIYRVFEQGEWGSAI